ncbi:3-hydroxyacyl-CoA dehydrogenase [Maribacter cobaltidurans]|uniref:3-hydroxyacyl-CoA dehydrogenase n=1 Tax=Maribacter cobaltidurans TaxID=1178778 RepID=A0A223V8C7_9FLAO|nr:3-hydroxyacyl-CoA dehydrogenase [Maribacter cobaltidurans]ASV31655.1 3-hydroxyacyl-CoA dehydrogenase [Maribacter cobaltidurans]GGD94059.1 3-hydroxyacyl-CoA dehydrogenase [Maribacter cobaltidurans]
MNIKDKTFLITGGASGLGAAVANTIVDHGGHVLLIDLKEAEGSSLAKNLGTSALFKKADVTDEESVRSAINDGVQKFGVLHGAISCAGIGPAWRVLGKEGLHELEDFSKVIQVNLIGTFNVLRLAAEVIQQNEVGESGERGVIINTASVAAFDGQIGQAAYSASKGGIVSMTLPIAREFARFGIRVMTIAPGIFETPMLQGLPEDAKISLGQQIPFPSRLGKPEEYAALAKHIIENQMLNGEVIRLDGAIRMTAK